MIQIAVPDYNDSFSRIVLEGKEYLIRFSYNENAAFWTFGLYDLERNPYVTGIRIVPNSPLNFFYQSHNLPEGLFFAISKLYSIGRQDFLNEQAKFFYTPKIELQEVFPNAKF